MRSLLRALQLAALVLALGLVLLSQDVVAARELQELGVAGGAPRSGPRRGVARGAYVPQGSQQPTEEAAPFIPAQPPPPPRSELNCAGYSPTASIASCRSSVSIGFVIGAIICVVAILVAVGVATCICRVRQRQPRLRDGSVHPQALVKMEGTFKGMQIAMPGEAIPSHLAFVETKPDKGEPWSRDSSAHSSYAYESVRRGMAKDALDASNRGVAAEKEGLEQPAAVKVDVPIGPVQLLVTKTTEQEKGVKTTTGMEATAKIGMQPVRGSTKALQALQTPLPEGNELSTDSELKDGEEQPLQKEERDR